MNIHYSNIPLLETVALTIYNSSNGYNYKHKLFAKHFKDVKEEDKSKFRLLAFAALTGVGDYIREHQTEIYTSSTNSREDYEKYQDWAKKMPIGTCINGELIIDSPQQSA